MIKENAFWDWFAANSERLMHFENDQETIFDELRDELHKIHEDLTFEISTIQEGKREFIISADGIQDAFPSVINLFDVAPNFENWIIIPFRPPIGVNFSITIGDYNLSPDDIWFSYELDENLISLVLYIRDLMDENQDIAQRASYILLDSALGEFVVETKIGFIEYELLPTNPEDEGLLPFTSIVSVFDEIEN